MEEADDVPPEGSAASSASVSPSRTKRKGHKEASVEADADGEDGEKEDGAEGEEETRCICGSTGEQCVFCRLMSPANLVRCRRR